MFFTLKDIYSHFLNAIVTVLALFLTCHQLLVEERASIDFQTTLKSPFFIFFIFDILNCGLCLYLSICLYGVIMNVLCKQISKTMIRIRQKSFQLNICCLNICH